MRVFISENDSPWINLAIEKWLLDRKDLIDQELLLLYRNSKSVIIGRFQNPWLECDLSQMINNNVSLARRESGGGAVYHDMGNTNFTFISNKRNFITEEKTALIIRALNSLGIAAEQGNRNDIYINKMKISGSASKYSSKRVLHHGTLLIQADLDAMNQYLIKGNNKSGFIKSRAIASIPSKVTNLQCFDKTLNHEKVCNALINAASDSRRETIEITELNDVYVQSIKEINDYSTMMCDWEWLFGHTPSFSVNSSITIGTTVTNCLFAIKKGRISEIDCNEILLDSDKIQLINDLYKNKKCDELMQQINV